MKKLFSKLWKIYKEKEEIINYLIVGGLTTVVSLATKYALLFTIFDAKNADELQYSIIISWIVAVTFAYILNRSVVFKSKVKNIFKEISKFFGARIATLIVEMIFMWFFVNFLKLNTDFYVIIFTIICQILIIVLNYIFSKIFVFKNKNIN